MQMRDQTWTVSYGGDIEVRTADGDLVAVVQDTLTANYIVDMHNAQIDKIENSVSPNHFNYEKMVVDLRETI